MPPSYEAFEPQAELGWELPIFSVIGGIFIYVLYRMYKLRK
jgi:hypothetical protein